tara:strand:+ start:1344 stop:1490 length:147 start_codon:yes stop_codon:yes gene_type:complete
MWFLIRPIVIRYRKFIAKKKGVEYKPLFPKVINRVDNFKNKIKNGKSI